MSRWTRGQGEVERLIQARRIEEMPGADHGVDHLMARARQALESADVLLGTDPQTAFVTAYDAAKHAGMALLARQGLRPTPRGGHVAIEAVLTAQFGEEFADYRSLRRRRNELDYPAGPDDFTDATEASRAIERVETLVDAATDVLASGRLGPW